MYFANKASMLIGVAGGCSNLGSKRGSHVCGADAQGFNISGQRKMCEQF